MKKITRNTLFIGHLNNWAYSCWKEIAKYPPKGGQIANSTCFFFNGLQDKHLTFDIFNSLLINYIKSWYYETTHWLSISHINMFFIYTNENIWSKILKFDLRREKQALYYKTKGVYLDQLSDEWSPPIDRCLNFKRHVIRHFLYFTYK